MSDLTGNRAGRRMAAASAPELLKQQRLTRMRATATGLLACMIGLLVVSIIFQRDYPALAWLRAFAEAGTVGAIADWYAVVALFRHPFGIPVPHTAVIPRNQARIASGLGSFVEQNFLTPEIVVDRLRGQNTAGAVAAWLARPENSRIIANSVADSVPALLRSFDGKEAARFFERTVVPQLRTLDVSRLAGNVLTILTEGDRHQPLLDHGLRALERWLVANSDMVKAKFGEASRYTPALLDAYIVNKFVEGIIALLHEVVANPDHELRQQFDAAVQELIGKLQASDDYRRVGKAWMRDCIRYLRREDYYRILWERARTRLSADIGSERSLIRDTMAAALASIGKSVSEDPGIQQKLNAWWLDLVRTMMLRYGRQISALITEVVQSWNADEVSRKIEAEIGPDLQYIRINGTFVGGAVGVLLHAGAVLLA
ncbi:DUF445 domain-containing protein [Cupriavidus sp. IDO]|uniref:DUF445 domain-containing protein n=1 Tax=Cupriavidus sp. IDO TaxID=1539142 RepID=UPI000AAC3887|nr:DUF445 domain-containing protein [Cupriavidus sp. IDO]